jgi:hypothetical protein
MRTPQGAPVRAGGRVRLNYGMRLAQGRRTYFMAWQTNHDAAAAGAGRDATGRFAADDMTEDGARCANAAVPRGLGSVDRPIAKDAGGTPRKREASAAVVSPVSTSSAYNTIKSMSRLIPADPNSGSVRWK